ncbi:host cell factor C1 regulator 1 isoform X1 [Dendropsophus ebraccatus]|uniref:host cell factor C1 regulator 1 isoform X1 n=1 Tax=Dendropsophus ebraccatus TaxID=150705 RepID=UPI0038313C41
MRVPGVRRRPDARCPLSARSDLSCTKRRFQEEDEGPAMKLYMSEDTVSARLQLLSLENDHSYGGNGLPKMSPLHQSPDTGPTDSSSEDENVVVDPGEFCMSGCQVISVCPLREEETLKELESIVHESAVPESVLSLSLPCLELVPWSPPSGPIHHLLCSLAGVEEGSGASRREVEEGMEL